MNGSGDNGDNMKKEESLSQKLKYNTKKYIRKEYIGLVTCRGVGGSWTPRRP